MITDIESLRENINSLDMRVANAQSYDDIELYDQYAALGLAAALLANAIRFSNIESLDDSKKCMEQAAQYGFQLDSKQFETLYSACSWFLSWNDIILRNKTKYESYYQNLFKKHASKIVEGWVIIKRKVDQRHIPDAWVGYDGEEIPVEVKRYKFDNAALRQLTRYMKFYKTEHGIAVGAELSVTLPDNITFVPISKLEELEAQETAL